MPRQLELVDGAYGIYAPDFGWGPRFVAGDLVFFHPYKPARRGNHALVEWSEMFFVVGEILDTRFDGVDVLVDGNQTFSISRSLISKIHRAVEAWFE